MFGKVDRVKLDLDEAIIRILTEMQEIGPDAQEYPTHVAHLERLYKLKTQTRRQPVSLDNAVLVLGNLMGILVIVAYEQKHVMVSKGLGFILKPR